MQNLNRGPDPRAYWRQVVVATLAVLVLPVIFIYALEAAGLLRSAALSVVVAIAASVGVATVGSAYWTRQGSKELVFGDLMVWSWLRRMRAERQLKKVWYALGLDERGEGTGAGLSPARQGEVLEQLATTLEARDLYTHGHSRRVTRHAHMIAKAMGLPAQHAEKVRAAAAMHDVGKLNVPRSVLNKPSRLDEEEFDLIKRHPAEGARMVAGLGDRDITAMIRHHHERLDGLGYPDGLSGEDIPLGARIIAVADTFDAITSSRPYRPARKHKQAISVLKEESGRQLDTRAVDAFLSYYSGRRAVAWWALVTTGFQRLLAALAGPIEGASASSITQGAVAVAASAALGTSLVAPVAPTNRQSERNYRAGASHAIEATAYRQATFAQTARGSSRGQREAGAGGDRHDRMERNGGKPAGRGPRGADGAGGRPDRGTRDAKPDPSKEPHLKEAKPAHEPSSEANAPRSDETRERNDANVTPLPVADKPSDSNSDDSDSGGSDSGDSGSNDSGSSGNSGPGGSDSGGSYESGSERSGSSGSGNGRG